MAQRVSIAAESRVVAVGGVLRHVGVMVEARTVSVARDLGAGRLTPGGFDASGFDGGGFDVIGSGGAGGIHIGADARVVTG